MLSKVRANAENSFAVLKKRNLDNEKIHQSVTKTLCTIFIGFACIIPMLSPKAFASKTSY